MGWDAPDTRTTGTLITADIWNDDVINNIIYLKGTSGPVVFENDLLSDTDVTDSMGSLPTQWLEGFFANLWGGRFKATPNRRELRVTWNNNAVGDLQVDFTEGGNGDENPGGSGQWVLDVTSNGAGNIRIDQLVEQNSALNNIWTPSKNPYFRCEFGISGVAGDMDIFMGFRETPSAVLPAGGESSVGLKYDGGGTAWVMMCSQAAIETASATVTNNVHHVMEAWVRSSTQAEVYLDGTLLGTKTVQFPTSAMEWTVMMVTDGGGAATVRYLTVGQIIVQEDVP